MSILGLTISFLLSLFKSQRQLVLENLALRQQVTMLRQSVKKVERVIGSIRRDCLDHVIIFNERHLRGILRDYFDYYHTCRTHLSLNKDSPQPRSVEHEALGNIVALPQVGGLHHRYTRVAA